MSSSSGTARGLRPFVSVSSLPVIIPPRNAPTRDCETVEKVNKKKVDAADTHMHMVLCVCVCVCVCVCMCVCVCRSTWIDTERKRARERDETTREMPVATQSMTFVLFCSVRVWKATTKVRPVSALGISLFVATLCLSLSLFRWMNGWMNG